MNIPAADIEYLCSTIAERSGNVVSPEQGYLLEARLKPLVQSAGLHSVHALVQQMRNCPHSRLHDRVSEAMTINETHFFRDTLPFDALREFVIPRLITRRQSVRQLSIWSAASSSGQEPYSVAMLLSTYFPDLCSWDVEILSTDYSEQMVARTSAGIYSPFEISRGLPESLLQQHFCRCGGQWQVPPELRTMVTACRYNLTSKHLPARKYDIILLRNVLIYFDQTTRTQILRRMSHSIRQDGYLFLGGGETLLHTDIPFRRTTIGRAVCFRPVANQES